MDSLIIYSQSDILALTDHRDGEIKLGQQVLVVSKLDEIINSSAKYVLLGIPEDIGVSANLGVSGANTAWKAAVKSILNIQSNSFLNGNELLVLGHFEIEEPTDQSLQGYRNKTSQIDALVYPVIEKIVRAGKIPIIIGGGHNNAAPIITGVSNALKQAINVVNIDAHADLRFVSEGRHSGNGFSYAIEKGFLNQYYIFGLHQNYVHQRLISQLATSKTIKTTYFEDILSSEKTIVNQWIDFTASLAKPCGLEIDLDSIENTLSSAVSPSGFTLNDIRKILLSNTKEYNYLHICEGATELKDGRKDLTTGKTIAYLVSDFIRRSSL